MDTALPPTRTRRLGGARITGATILGLLGLLLLAAGVAGLWQRAASPDGGYVMTGTHLYESSGRAVVSDPMHVDVLPDWLVARVKIKATADEPVFVGVGRRADVDRYLAGVARSTVEDLNFDPFAVDYRTDGGSTVPAPPAAQSFWAVSSVGSGLQTVSWKARQGSWRVVVMNADGSAGVAADARVGASISGALVVAIVLTALGAVLAAVAVALVVPRSRTGA